MKPNLIDLQNFTNSYFKNDPPIVKWEYLGKRVRSKSFVSTRIIYLDSVSISLTATKEFAPEWNFSRESISGLKLSPGEHYFLALLREIAHFKIKSELTAERIQVKEQLLQKVEQDLVSEKCNRKKSGKSPMGEKEEQEFRQKTMEHYLAHEVILSRMKDGKDEEYQERLQRFRGWLKGDYVSERSLIDSWTINEFKKKRKAIREILKKDKK